MLLSRRTPLASRCGATALAVAASFVWTLAPLAAQAPLPGAAGPAGEAADAPVPPASERGGSDAPTERLRYALQVAYPDEAQLGTIVTKLVAHGATIEGLEIHAGKGEGRSSTLRISMPDPELLRGLSALLDPASVVRCELIAPPGMAGRAAAGQATHASFAFEDADLTKVLDTIARNRGADIIVDRRVKGRVTMRLHGVPWREALEVAARQVGATVQELDHGLLYVTLQPPKQR